MSYCSSRYRRNLTDAQRVRIGVAQEAYFAEQAKEAQRESGGDKKSELAKSVGPNLAQPIRDESKRSEAQAAESVGLKRETYRKGKKILKAALTLERVSVASHYTLKLCSIEHNSPRVQVDSLTTSSRFFK